MSVWGIEISNDIDVFLADLYNKVKVVVILETENAYRIAFAGGPCSVIVKTIDEDLPPMLLAVSRAIHLSVCLMVLPPRRGVEEALAHY